MALLLLSLKPCLIFLKMLLKRLFALDAVDEFREEEAEEEASDPVEEVEVDSDDFSTRDVDRDEEGGGRSTVCITGSPLSTTASLLSILGSRVGVCMRERERAVCELCVSCVWRSGLELRVCELRVSCV